MPKASVAPDVHTLYLRRFPKDLTRRVKSQAALQGCTISQALTLILREYFKAAK